MKRRRKTTKRYHKSKSKRKSHRKSHRKARRHNRRNPAWMDTAWLKDFVEQDQLLSNEQRRSGLTLNEFVEKNKERLKADAKRFIATRQSVNDYAVHRSLHLKARRHRKNPVKVTTAANAKVGWVVQTVAGYGKNSYGTTNFYLIASPKLSSSGHINVWKNNRQGKSFLHPTTRVIHVTDFEGNF